jgi:propanediol dehydratase small subunit
MNNEVNKMRELTRKDYPLGIKRQDLLFSPTGKSYNELTLDAALKGEVEATDLRISAETLRMQSEIAEDVGRKQLARNFRRAAELIAIPDTRILEIYNALRPRRSTKEELLNIARELEEKYGATENARLVREAADVYQRRGILKTIEG